MSRMVVVSNRVAPIDERKGGAQGGLAVAIQAALKQKGGIWFGWSGEVKENPEDQPHQFSLGALKLRDLRPVAPRP